MESFAQQILIRIDADDEEQLSRATEAIEALIRTLSTEHVTVEIKSIEDL